jgi:YD repeat-containing protein
MCGTAKCSTTNLPSALTPWILGRYSERQTLDGLGRIVLRTIYDFGEDGFLRGRRIMMDKPSATAAGDVLTLFTRARSAEKVILTSDYFGGDAQALCSAQQACTNFGRPAGNPQYRIVDTFTHGTLSRSAYMDWAANGEEFELMVTADHFIDRNSGAILRSTEFGGAFNRYSYDSLGRLTGIVPRDDVSTGITYQIGSVSGATVTVQRPENSGTMGKEIHEYDGRGQLVKSRRSMPDGVESKKLFRYTATGAKRCESTPYSGSDPDCDVEGIGKRTHKNFDPFGRSDTTVQPDAKTSTFGFGTTIGSRVASRGSEIRLVGGLQSIERQEVYDRYGRLVKIDDDIPSTTRYDYDVLDRLRTVTQGTQERSFHYDRRGFLESETQPEITGGIAYGSYDARGHVLSTTIAGMC